MPEYFKWKFPYPSQRMPVLAENIVATSQPLAAQAGLRMLLKGGNAVDAAIATAITLTVVEPTMNGLGSDAFAIIWDKKNLVGLNASGRSPVAWTLEYFSKYKEMPLVGWDTVTVPGAVSAWVELSKRYGQLDFKELFEPAIHYAKNGYVISPIVANSWKTAVGLYRKFPEFRAVFTRNGKALKAGEIFQLPDLAKSLKLIASTNGEAFYSGDLAKQIVSHAENTDGWLSLEDLEDHKADWVNPISIDYKDVTLHEIPPNGQGIAALIALGILGELDLGQHKVDSAETLHLQIEAMKLAFSDAHRYVADPSYLELDPRALLNTNYLKKRASLIDETQALTPTFGDPKPGDTVYLTTADSEGMMVSYIQSNYLFFGSGIIVPHTGISLQNRGYGFTLQEGHPNQVGPSKRPFHTIIPAFITSKGKPIMSFGVMGGPMQPQGHLQMMLRIFEYGQNPQAASDAIRWCIAKGLQVNLEKGIQQDTASKLAKLGHQVTMAAPLIFGGAQAIFKLESGYLGASDHRKDGQAVGF